MRHKFTLIGLPGVGKSTVSRECVQLLQTRGIICDIKSTDEIIRNRFKADDPVIIQFEKKIGKIPSDIFSAPEPISAFIKKFGEEPLFRDLEEIYIKDILQSFNKHNWLDIGGKAPLRKATINTLRDKQIIPIFLHAPHEIIISRLEKDNNWKKRNNYLNAGVDQWKILAENHRNERLLKYYQVASIVISIDTYPEIATNKLNDENEEKRHVIRLKTAKELANEIFYRINELELICIDSTRSNHFSNQNRLFFLSAKVNDYPDKNCNDTTTLKK